MLPRLARRTAAIALLLVILAGLGVFGARWRATTIVTGLLQAYAVSQVATASDGAYRLEIGRIRFTWSLRRFTLDSALLTTDSAALRGMARPPTSLRIVLRDCTVGGISLSRIVLGRGVHATRLGCTTVRAEAWVPRRQEVRVFTEAVRDTQGSPAGLVREQRRIEMPASVPRIHIRQVSFPDVSLLLVRPASLGGESRIELEKLAWSIADLAFDPADRAASSRPLFSRSIEVAGQQLHFHPDSASLLSVGSLRISLTDSLVDLRDVAFGPLAGDVEVARSGPWRRDPMRARLSRLEATGVDLRALATGLATRVRRLTLDSLAIRAYSDKRMPKNPARREHLSPQDWMAQVQAEISIDSVIISHGSYIYRERRTGYQPSLLSFTDIEALATNVRHLPGRRTTARVAPDMTGPDVMTLTTTSIFEGAGRLELEFTVPLDARRFDMTFGGTLGPFDGSEVNPLVETNQPVRVTNGRLDGVTLNAVVSGGVANGNLMLRYHDLTLAVTRRGNEGILGHGGFWAGLARAIAGVKVNATSIRRNNPAHEGESPASGRIHHVFTPDQTLPAFLWKSTRGAIEEVVIK